MPSKIHVLDEHTINKIAAGEVIENPASVVKELTENAIDAQSTDICIEIRGGGRQLIRITDNGSGMNQDDALLCLERHATSKIREMEDIYAIGTMGFRGEAVPSIAAISKFTLLTCDSENNQGTMVIVEGGKILQCCPVTHSKGTTIEVKTLFFNVPVRKKFQKSPAYDANEILNTISGIALGHPEIRFQLISDQKTILTTKASGEHSFTGRLRDRIEDILGSEGLESICEVEAEQNGFCLQGFIGLPSHTRNNRTGQYLFINRRLVASHRISFFIRDGYGTTLSTGRHPVYVLHLTMPPALVDVNVHPQKREVRLRQEQVLKEMICQSISKALQSQGENRDNAFVLGPVFLPPFPRKLENSFFPTSKPFIESKQFIDSEPFNESKSLLESKPFNESIPFVEPVLKPYKNEAMILAEHKRDAIQLLSKSPHSEIPRVLATFKHYIIVEGENLCLIDQRAAHSRIIYEKLMQRDEKHPTQPLLITYSFETTPIESALLLEHLESLNQLGIIIHQTGSNAFVVDAIPHFFGNIHLNELVDQIIQDLREHQSMRGMVQEQNKKIAIAASRAAISHKTRLSIEEAQSLVNQLMRSSTPYQCPFGKPVMIYFTYEEMEKRFQMKA